MVLNFLARLKVLVIDDNEFQVTMLKDYIEDVGHEVYGCTDSEEALEMVKEQLEKESPFHVIFIDYRMPKIKGPRLSRMIKEVCPESIRVGMTVYDSDKDIVAEICLEGHFDHVISKHDPLDTVKKTLNTTLSTLSHR